MKIRIRILCICFLVLAGFSRLFAETSEIIRVLVLDNVSEVDVFVKGGYEIRSFVAGKPSDAVLGKGRKSLHKKFRLEGGFLNITSAKTGAVIIIPKRGVFYINNRALRGSLLVRKNKASKLSLINYIGLEDYIKGVLFHEVSHRWPIEVLKAQAVAVRTYAFYHAKINRDQDYDLTADVYSQVYGGKDSERYRTNRAVALTRGLVLTYNGEVFPAYFHATCAGATEDADQLWDIDLASLKSVDCKLCRRSPHFRWQKILRLTEIIDRLNTSGYNFNSLKDIQIIDRNRSGRIKTLRLKLKAQPTSGKAQPTSGKAQHTSGEDTQVIIPAKDFREILGPKDIRSTNFTLKIVDSDVYFEGFGWGHGVGLCQWGAYFLAKIGYKYQAIVQFYYLDCRVEKI